MKIINHFWDKNDVFPLLSKIITAEDNLSIQVHPDDEYSLKHENMLGKPECWYILDCPENAELILGHSAKNKQELEQMVHDAQWDKLFTKVKIKKVILYMYHQVKFMRLQKG